MPLLLPRPIRSLLEGARVAIHSPFTLRVADPSDAPRYVRPEHGASLPLLRQFWARHTQLSPSAQSEARPAPGRVSHCPRPLPCRPAHATTGA